MSVKHYINMYFKSDVQMYYIDFDDTGYVFSKDYIPNIQQMFKDHWSEYISMNPDELSIVQEKELGER